MLIKGKSIYSITSKRFDVCHEIEHMQRQHENLYRITQSKMISNDQVAHRSSHERDMRVLCLLTTERQTAIIYY